MKYNIKVNKYERYYTLQNPVNSEPNAIAIGRKGSL